ncbi:hypothetical protein BHE74_00044986 [Ensete ventricosum]|nr:hypothetical protein BHE74_00044986 [Ensete ventricosum]RZS03929.1 hypothetical protein BHM03_00034183 [Ensete ventricosum]
MAGVPGTASAIFGTVKDVGANVIMISQVEVIPRCSILATVGQKMASTPGVSATLFDALAKVIILARESGLKLELSDIPVQSLVPEPLRVLRYVGVVDAVNEKGRVELRRYKREHPFAQLSGSDNIIAFTTTRYKNQPLIVRGPGAGAEVTAGGVFSDILRLASYLGAPS